MGLAGGHGACGAVVTYYDASQPPTLDLVSPGYVRAASGGDNQPTLLTLQGGNFAPTAGLACNVDSSEWEARRGANPNPNPSPDPNPNPNLNPKP